MTAHAEAVFEAWEKALKFDNIRQRMTEVLEKRRLQEMLDEMLVSTERSMEFAHGRKIERPAVGILSIWDLVALVGRDSAGGYCIGVGLGSLRLLDLFSACLCAFLFEQHAEARNRAQRIVGAVLYDYARRLINRLRHWSLDPTLGLARPYGFVKLELGSIVPDGYQRAHHFFLEVLVTWVLAHEIAHVTAGDLDANRTTAVMGMAKRRVTLSADEPRPEKEFQADLAALRAVFEGHRDMLPPAFTAVSYFLGLLEIVERISTEPVFSGPGHPAPSKRLEYLIHMLPAALPDVREEEIAELRAIGADLGNFSKGISDRILEVPQDFRIAPTVIEDYQEDAPGSSFASEAAAKNNDGDVKRGKGDLHGALALYSAAETLLRQADYGEGHRIVYTNLIQTTAALNRPLDALRWMCEAVGVAKSNYDKPAILYMLRIYSRVAAQSGSLREQAVRELRLLLDSRDPELESCLSLLYPGEAFDGGGLGTIRKNMARGADMTMPRIFVILRAALYTSAFVLLWAWLAVAVQPLDARLPFTIPAWARPLGWPLVLLGALLALWCIITFVATGRGTPAPFDPPREFVAAGPYRYVRNPMYIGGFGVLLGAGLILRSPSICGLAFLFLLLMHLLVLLYEEPALTCQFGDPYRQYKTSVRRWLPRFPGTLKA